MADPEPGRPLRGAVLMTAAAGLVAATSLLAKVLGTGLGGPALHPLQISAGRFVAAFTVLLVLAPLFRLRLAGAPYRLHALRSVCGWLGVTFMFAAAARMPLAEATAISFLNPVAAMVLAIPLLGERVGPIRWTAVAISATGALILIRPGTDAFQLAAMLALTAAFMMGLEAVFIKRLSRTEPTIRILFVNNMIGAMIAAAAATFVWVAPSATQWGFLGLLGVVMLCAQTCFIQAMKCADASYVMPFFYAALVFATFYDFVVFGVIPESLSFAGAAVIVAAALFLAWRERQRRQQPDAAPLTEAGPAEN